MSTGMDEIRSLVEEIYGPEDGRRAFGRIAEMIAREEPRTDGDGDRFDQSDVILITYGDTLSLPGKPPLQALHGFARRYLRPGFSGIHFLPFFPYSSDDGFAVIDFLKINPDLGTWEDVERFRTDFDPMFDYVLNHISARSPWFDHYLALAPGYEDLAIEVPPHTDLSKVTRPRTLPLLTPFQRKDGTRVWVWTTFSADQVDLNYRSVDVLCNMVAVLLMYVRKGARLIRMDAVAYLWKEIGTPCIHLPGTHAVLRLLRRILDQVDPAVMIITETNVPHEENIGYFGNGYDEAQLVYNFSLPPLLLHTLATKDASLLMQWAEGLITPSEQTTFFNFTASHDGIGVRPLEGLLPGPQIEALAGLAVRSGGRVSYKQNSDGSRSPYELNVTYLDAMDADPAKFLASQAIALVLPGVPAVYIHSLLGSRNWHEGVALTGRARSINRARLSLDALVAELEDGDSFRASIFHPYLHLLKVRRAQPAFHPNAGFRIVQQDSRVFGIERRGRGQRILSLTNISPQAVDYPLHNESRNPRLRDLISGRFVDTQGLRLRPYECLWLVE